MKTTQYVRQEKAIAAADAGSIRERWLWGLRLLADTDQFTPTGRLKQGVTEQLVEAARAAGIALSDGEVRRRLRCARAYPKESQLGRALTEFESWFALGEAGFPPYDAPEDEPAFDFRTDAERKRDRARDLASTADREQMTLFPLDTFEPREATLKELLDYANEQAAITERFARRDRERAEYLAALITAADGDLSVTWQVAHERGVEAGTIDADQPTGRAS